MIRKCHSQLIGNLLLAEKILHSFSFACGKEKVDQNEPYLTPGSV